MPPTQKPRGTPHSGANATRAAGNASRSSRNALPARHGAGLGGIAVQCSAVHISSPNGPGGCSAHRRNLPALPACQLRLRPNLACFLLSSRGGSPRLDRPGDRTRPSLPPSLPPLEALGPEWVGFEIGELASILGAALLWAVNSAAAAAPLCCNDTTTDRPKPAQAAVQQQGLAPTVRYGDGTATRDCQYDRVGREVRWNFHWGPARICNLGPVFSSLVLAPTFTCFVCSPWQRAAPSAYGSSHLRSQESRQPSVCLSASAAGGNRTGQSSVCFFGSGKGRGGEGEGAGVGDGKETRSVTAICRALDHSGMESHQERQREAPPEGCLSFVLRGLREPN